MMFRISNLITCAVNHLNRDIIVNENANKLKSLELLGHLKEVYNLCHSEVYQIRSANLNESRRNNRSMEGLKMLHAMLTKDNIGAYIGVMNKKFDDIMNNIKTCLNNISNKNTDKFDFVLKYDKVENFKNNFTINEYKPLFVDNYMIPLTSIIKITGSYQSLVNSELNALSKKLEQYKEIIANIMPIITHAIICIKETLNNRVRTNKLWLLYGLYGEFLEVSEKVNNYNEKLDKLRQKLCVLKNIFIRIFFISY